MGEVLHNTYVLFISLMYLFLFILYFIREVFYITKVNDIKSFHMLDSCILGLWSNTMHCSYELLSDGFSYLKN